MQPAVPEWVQNVILPGSAATAICRLLAIRSLPGCGHFARGSPKSSRYVPGPTTGKISRGTAPPGRAAPAPAMGADRALLVTDDAAEGSDLVATSRVLAAVLEREQPDLVLFGQQASDSDGAVLWAAVAERLRRPLVSQAAELEVEGGKVRAKRQTEFGYDRIEAPLPAVVAVSDAINEPRYPSLKGIMGAKSKPQETLSLADLGIDAGQAGEAGSATEVHELQAPPSRGDSVRIEADA